MRIAHLIDSLHWGGAQKLLILFAEEAKSRGLDFTIISLRPNTKNSPYPAQLESMGVRVIMLSIDRLYSPNALPTLIKLFRQERFNVVQTHLQHANILGMLAGRIAGVPTIATLHSTNVHVQGYFHYLRQIADWLTLNYGARRVIAVGYSVADAYQKKIRARKIDVIPNAVRIEAELSLDERGKIRRELTGDASHPLIITVGRLMVDKGYADLIASFAHVHERHPQAFLVIVGDGELRSDLESYVLELGLSNCVRLTGARTDVPKLLAASDMYVSSSYREGLSVALMEAMAAGLSILATNVGDTQYLLGKGQGIMVEPHDIPALTREMNLLLDDPAKMKRLGVEAYDFVKTHYAPGPWLDQLLGVYALTQKNTDAGNGVGV